MKKLACLMLSFLLTFWLLVGCSNVTNNPGMNPGVTPPEELQKGSRNITAYQNMKYTRPDLEEMERLKATIAKAAYIENNTEEIARYLIEFYDAYDWFYTNSSLADIHYCADMTDAYWEEEYAFCAANSAWVEGAMEEIFYTLAQSPACDALEEEYFGDGWFDAYKGENNWDEAFVALLEEESALQNRYYELSSIALDYEYGTPAYFEACGDEMVELMVELIGVRQKIAAYWGYPDYPSFASDFYYYRDYTPDQTERYLSDIRQELVPLYAQLNSSFRFRVDCRDTTEAETYSYVRSMAGNMGGTVKSAFDLMDRAGLYDISYGKNKYSASFEVYLTMYEEPFIFMNPCMDQYDHLTFAHEFGHFCNDYAAGGTHAGTDVLEVFSQAMEYLSLCYADGGSELTRLKMWDSLCLMVEQAAFASFESRMYELKGEELTVENLRALYDQVAREYGFESVGYDDREFITIPHFYTNPMYVISYVVSNDSAMQFYQLEQTQSGTGLEVFQENLDTEAYYFLEFLEDAELESPFAPGRVAQLRRTFEAALQ